MKRILISLMLVGVLAGLVLFMGDTLLQDKTESVLKAPGLELQESEKSSVINSADNMVESVEAFQRLLATYQGDVVYLDFWASWCTPCRESFPWMNEMQAKYQGAGLRIITVNLDVNRENANQFLVKYPATFDVFFDPKGQVARHYDLPGMPSSMIFNRDGKLIERHVGFNKEKQKKYQLQLEDLLNE